MSEQAKRLDVTLQAYLKEVEAAELRKPEGERRHVPSARELAEASDVSARTVQRLLSGNIIRLDLDLIEEIVNELSQRGFPCTVHDLLVYHE